MASLRKIRVTANRAKIRAEVKARAKEQKRLEAEKKIKSKQYREEVRIALGFDKLKIRRRKTKEDLYL